MASCTCDDWGCDHDLYAHAHVVPEMPESFLNSMDVDLMSMVDPYNLFVAPDKCVDCLCWLSTCGCTFRADADHSKIVWTAEIQDEDTILRRTPSDVPLYEPEPSKAPLKPVLRNQPPRLVKRVRNVSFSATPSVAFIPSKSSRNSRYFLSESENRVISHEPISSSA